MTLSGKSATLLYMTTTPQHLTSNPETGTIVCVDCFFRRPVEQVDPDTQVCQKCSKGGRR